MLRKIINRIRFELVKHSCGTWYDPYYGLCPVCYPNVLED